MKFEAHHRQEEREALRFTARRMRSTGGKAALALLITSAVFGVLPATAASADEVTFWKNRATERFLEVWFSQTGEGATVGTWAWNGGPNQQWWESSSNSSYNHYTNMNSGRKLYAAQQCYRGLYQTDTAYNNSDFRTIFVEGRWQLISRTGCDGDIYHDVVSQSHDSPGAFQVYLYHSGVPAYEKGCLLKPGLQTIADYCNWDVFVQG
ncbi:RICIN domain-containing protein [Sphaerisporangium sp. TRM90804]|uniref:RICIN domain-containing protein n=1 Tax=Sphaerisporangium sp. TRM90804 TaxID=3031113 RepID=UPI00244CBDBC|nr:RICIN domain-containing protein [Sphaerisporangium sp. TRM90804]MDH2428496.1 RICIN domain-containing protein [Sphaerisporangium sp. TRM90804]